MDHYPHPRTAQPRIHSSAHLLIIAFGSLLLSACQKEISLSDSSSAMSPGQTKSLDASAQLKAMGDIELAIQSVAGKPEFHDMVVTKVGEKFDEDSDVLLVDLCTLDYADPEIDVAMDDVEAQLVNFRDIEGRTYYPQIHIPYFDDLGAVLRTRHPVTVVFLEDLTGKPDGDQHVVSGQQLSEQGLLNPVPAVDGSFAHVNEVWVLSLNERVDDSGTLINDVSQRLCSWCLDVNVRIDNVALKDPHESWLGGDSELHILGFRTYWNSYDPANGSYVYSRPMEFESNGSDYGTNYVGSQITTISSDDVDAWTHFNVDFPLVVDWERSNFHTQPVVMGYAIFEYDPWPAATKYWEAQMPNGSARGIRYRSAHLAYHTGRWMSNTLSGAHPPQAVGFHYDNSEIEYNLESY